MKKFFKVRYLLLPLFLILSVYLLNHFINYKINKTTTWKFENIDSNSINQDDRIEYLVHEVESLKAKLSYKKNKKKNQKSIVDWENQSVLLTKIHLPIIKGNVIKKSNGFSDVHEDKVYFVTGFGDFFLVNKNNNSGNEYEIDEIKSNYKSSKKIFGNRSTFSTKYHGIRDLEIIENKIYISYVREVKKNCLNISILSAELNTTYLNFENFFMPTECIGSDYNDLITGDAFDSWHTGGKIIDYKNDRMLLSTGEWRVRQKAQDKKSIFGKIISIDKLKNMDNYNIISMGHRNPQGLYYSKEDDLIISTEHGPVGGDEININLNPSSKNIKNYGWPISSYGKHYIDNDSLKKFAPLHKSHTKFGFIEPLRYYSPAIAPTEITKIPKNFNKEFVNDYLVTTLGYPYKTGGEFSLIHIRLDSENNKIIYHQTIDIDERIRDIDFLIKEKKIILSLESSNSIGILSFN